MRWSLLESFDKIYILDLHGNSKKKETAPDGSADKNVFDITARRIHQPVCQNRQEKTRRIGKRISSRLIRRSGKANISFLWENNLNKLNFKELKTLPPYYFFVPKDYRLQAEYDKGFSVDKIVSHEFGWNCYGMR